MSHLGQFYSVGVKQCFREGTSAMAVFSHYSPLTAHSEIGTTMSWTTSCSSPHVHTCFYMHKYTWKKHKCVVLCVHMQRHIFHCPHILSAIPSSSLESSYCHKGEITSPLSNRGRRERWLSDTVTPADGC